MKQLNKNIYRALIILSFIAVNGFILFGIGSVLAFLNSGADRANMLHSEPQSVDVYLPEVSWVSLDNPGRPMEQITLAQIQEDYLDAWYVRNVAYQSNNKYGIDDYYTDSSRVNLYNAIEYNKQNGITIEASTLNHRPKLEFYSADGQLAVFTDEQVVEYQKIFQNNELMITTRDTSAYQVMMLLEDGFWRIRHMVKTENPTDSSTDTLSNQIVQVNGNKILVHGNVFQIKGINYYPQNSPWDTFGEDFNLEILNKDFGIIKSVGLNTIRIFIQYEDFGKAEVKAEKLEKLELLLDLANKNNLKVIPTLFDFYGDYSVLDWTLTHRHAQQIVSRIRNHPAILAWDIKNEPDLDFDSRGKENVLDWLNEMVDLVKKYDPGHPVTIGWSSPEAAVLLKNKVDLVSFHYYRSIDDFEQVLSELEKQVPNKALVLQEFGMSSYKGIWNPFGNNEKDQAEYHKKMQAALKKHELAFLSWTLYDFDKIPSSVVGQRPWRKSKQREFGFLDRLGNPKPAFDFITY